jgi:hypothetical protein
MKSLGTRFSHTMFISSESGYPKIDRIIVYIIHVYQLLILQLVNKRNTILKNFCLHVLGREINLSLVYSLRLKWFEGIR